MMDAGAVMLGKTNTPEFGAGSQTFNDVFGATYNPYDLSKTPGGSSGGSAAALAARLVTLADGSDNYLEKHRVAPCGFTPESCQLACRSLVDVKQTLAFYS